MEQLFSDQEQISFGLAPYSGHDEVFDSKCNDCGDNNLKCHPLCKCNSCVKNLADHLSSTFNVNTKFVFGLTGNRILFIDTNFFKCCCFFSFAFGVLFG